MAAYLIVQINIQDPDIYEDYKKQVVPTTEAYGGEYLVRGGAQEVMEGDWPWARTVIIRFPSMEQARAWHSSPEYEGPKALRHSASEGNAIIVEGA